MFTRRRLEAQFNILIFYSAKKPQTKMKTAEIYFFFGYIFASQISARQRDFHYKGHIL